ncbi:hypothetical protein O181_090278 [Austropuccinia psidii MF-1]|uniref:Uncharacterized protein n=1 Tax=Austropuccinia psidii MF-1 TaxID=1389203 RepID=A0A9Q3P689_9BASI|nr:hypothetical protein [Austropuccinia psidii MF-1]
MSAKGDSNQILAHQLSRAKMSIWNIASGRTRNLLSRQGKPFPNHGPRPSGTLYGAYVVLYIIMSHFSSEIQLLQSQDSNLPSEVKSPVHEPILKEGFQRLKLVIHGGH